MKFCCYLKLVGILFSFLVSGAQADQDRCAQTRDWVARVLQDTSWVEITNFPGISLDLRYSTEANITGKNLACSLQQAFLHKEAAKTLERAVRILHKDRPSYRLRIFDAGRPPWIQADLWAVVRNTPQAKYVTPPRRISMHTYGMAVDLTLEDGNGSIVDMGTSFDAFVAESEITYEDSALVIGTLLPEQVENRRYLRSIMRQAGWIPLPAEWWHFNARPAKWVRENLEPQL